MFCLFSIIKDNFFEIPEVRFKALVNLILRTRMECSCAFAMQNDFFRGAEFLAGGVNYSCLLFYILMVFVACVV